MKNVNNEYVILSSQLSDLTPQINQRRHETLCAILDDLGVFYNEVNGFYNGFTETSVMVRLEHYKGYDELFFEDIARKNFTQESILFVDKYNHGRLIRENSVEYLGKIGKISQEKANTLEAFTWIPTTNTFLGVI